MGSNPLHAIDEIYPERCMETDRKNVKDILEQVILED